MPAGSLIDRVLDVFDLLADFPHGLQVSDIARRIKFPKSEAYRLLTVMARRDFVAQDPVTQRYRLSVRTAAIGFRFFGKVGLGQLCGPVLDRLAASTGELVRLAVVESNDLHFIANSQGALTGLRYDPDLGRTPATLHATANGRAWLATLDIEDAVDLVKKRGFDLPSTDCTSAVIDETSLRGALARVVEDGYSVSVEESIRGIVTMAAAIPNRVGGSAVGCVSVAGPTVRLTHARVSEIAPTLIAAAEELARIWPLPYDGRDHRNSNAPSAAE